MKVLFVDMFDLKSLIQYYHAYKWNYVKYTESILKIIVRPSDAKGNSKPFLVIGFFFVRC